MSPENLRNLLSILFTTVFVSALASRLDAVAGEFTFDREPLAFVGLYGSAILAICVFFLTTYDNKWIDRDLMHGLLGLLWTIFLALYPYASYQFALLGSTFHTLKHQPELWALILSLGYLIFSLIILGIAQRRRIIR